uniref:Ergosterol biosynthesis 28 homolog n=2 Tax=Gasterosteus aculeatus aculeatus TaxID=481459 RepID=A0AAQ4NWC0_GASAC
MNGTTGWSHFLNSSYWSSTESKIRRGQHNAAVRNRPQMLKSSPFFAHHVHIVVLRRPPGLTGASRGRNMSRFLNVLRSWLLMVSIIAVGNTVQSFRDHGFLSEKLYTGAPQFVNGLQARTFGIWTLLSSIIRCSCAIDIHNRTLYHITLWTFVLALGHFLSEAFVYKTAPLTIGVMAPLIVAGFSIIGMLIGYHCIPESQQEVGARQKKRN